MSTLRPVAARRVRRPRIAGGRLALKVVLIAAAVVAALWLLDLVFRERLGISLFSSQARGEELSAAEGAPLPALRVLRPAGEERFLRSVGVDPDRIFAPWIARLREMGAQAVEVEALSEQMSAMEPGGVIILPSATCLSRDERRALDDHLHRGGGIVICGAAGVRNEQGEWAGWQELRWLLGVVTIQEMERERAAYITCRGGQALTTGVAPGERIDLRPLPGCYAVATRDGDLFWSSYTLDLRLHEPSGIPLAAALASETEGGRIAWFGFNPCLSASYTEDDAVLATVLRNTLFWCAGAPRVELAIWPEGRPLAVLLAEDTEHEFANARGVGELLVELGVPATFCCISDMARQQSDLTRWLGGHFELASHTDNHTVIAGAELAVQQERLQRSRADLDALGGGEVHGFRPPEEQIDDVTLSALRGAGYRYVLGDPTIARAAPYAIAASPIIRIPRAARDDYDLIVKSGLTSVATIGSALDADLEEVAFLGGLYYLSFHTQLLARADYREVLREVVQRAREREAWLATAGEIADWWERRSLCTVKTQADVQGGWRVAVANRGLSDILDLALSIQIPRSAGAMTVHYERADGQLILVGELHPSQLRAFTLDRLEPGEVANLRIGSPTAADAAQNLQQISR